MAKKIIFTADDYGPIPSINQGIHDAIKDKKVNSVAAFSNFKGSVKAVGELLTYAKTQGHPIDLGIHLTITSGKPLATNVPSLVKADGHFLDFKKFKKCQIKLEELERELIRQIEEFTKAGLPVKHISNHHGMINSFPDLYMVYVRVGLKFGLPMRSPVTIPLHKVNLYRTILKPMQMDAMSKPERDFMYYFLHNDILRQAAATYGGGQLKTPEYLDMRHYAAFDPIKIDDSGRIKRAIKAVNSNQINELVLHLRKKQDKENNKAYKKEVENSGYSGINWKHFDERVNELKSLEKARISKWMKKFGVSYGKWSEVKATHTKQCV